MDNENAVLRSTDLYECAYYFTNGCTIRNVELIKEHKRLVCFLHMSGDGILGLQQSYFKSEAVVNLFDFRRSYSRVLNVIALAKKQGGDK